LRCGDNRGVEIRPATFDDVDAIRDLMVASMSALGPGFYTPEETASATRYLTVPDVDLIEDGTLYVAEAAPFATGGAVSPPPAPPHFPRDGDRKVRLVIPAGKRGGESIVGVGGWSSRQKLFTGSEDQEGLVGRLDPKRDAARIRAFFVVAAFARQGIARKLYEQCAAGAHEAGFRSLSLMATLPGVPLYRALGFRHERPTMVALPDGTELPCVEMGREIGR
jgi:GNAT superfamily N-acetyltransferase